MHEDFLPPNSTTLIPKRTPNCKAYITYIQPKKKTKILHIAVSHHFYGSQL